MLQSPTPACVCVHTHARAHTCAEAGNSCLQALPSALQALGSVTMVLAWDEHGAGSSPTVSTLKQPWPPSRKGHSALGLGLPFAAVRDCQARHPLPFCQHLGQRRAALTPPTPPRQVGSPRGTSSSSGLALVQSHQLTRRVQHQSPNRLPCFCPHSLQSAPQERPC